MRISWQHLYANHKLCNSGTVEITQSDLTKYIVQEYIYTVNDKSFTVRKLSRFSWIFIKPWKFSLLKFCFSESSDMYEGGDRKNRVTFPRIPDELSKPRNFSPSKLLSFTVHSKTDPYAFWCYYIIQIRQCTWACITAITCQFH